MLAALSAISRTSTMFASWHRRHPRPAEYLGQVEAKQLYWEFLGSELRVRLTKTQSRHFTLTFVARVLLSATTCLLLACGAYFTWSLYHWDHPNTSTKDPIQRVYIGELRYINAAQPTPADLRYVVDEGTLGARTYAVDWRTNAEEVIGSPPQHQPPVWSIHSRKSPLRWPPETRIAEVAMGVPIRCIVAIRATSGMVDVPPRGMTMAELDGTGFIWHVRWWAVLVNIAFFVPIVLALRKGPWAVMWLRGHLRRRRGLCEACAYPVRGLARCPECGTSVEGATKSVTP